MNINGTNHKEKIAGVIRNTIISRNYTQQTAAKILDCSQPRLSNLMNMKVELFKIDMLLLYAEKLGYTINIDLAPLVYQGRSNHV